MEQSLSWEANQFAANQEIPRILWNPKGSLQHLQVPATCPYPEPARSNPCPTSHFLKIHLYIIRPSTPGSSKWSLSLKFPHQSPLYISHLPICTTCPTHLILLDFITRTILDEQYRSLSSSLCSFLHYFVTSSLLGPSILLHTLFSNIQAYVPHSTWATKFHTHTKQRYF